MLKIGLLLDGFKLKRWQIEIIDFIVLSPELELELVVINSNASSDVLNQKKIFYKIFSRLDRSIFSVKNDAFQVINIEQELRKYKLLKVFPKILNFGFKFTDDQIKDVLSFNLDILIRFGFGFLKGEILNSSKFGVWSLHHGDNSINRGGPPGFWEVVNNESVTGVTLQKLTNDLDGGNVIRKSYINTNKTSFHRNQNELFWAGVELFNSSLSDFAEGKLHLDSNEMIERKFYDYPLYKDPDNLHSFKIFYVFWKRRLKEYFIGLNSHQNWYLAFYFSKQGKIQNSFFRYKKLIPPKGFEWADPFVIFFSERYFLFFENLEKSEGKAHISYIEFSGKGKLISSIPQTVLKENFHLSYPFIFKLLEEFYMVPEMAESNELWIYKSNSFPLKWEKYHQIFDNKEIYDPTLLLHNGTWFLFGTEKYNIGSSRDQYLKIYYTNDLFQNNWKEHPLNPITRDVRGARPAGKIFKWSDKLIRPGQIGTPNYGHGIQLFEIIKLSKTSYEEKLLESILPNWDRNIRATHTINYDNGFSVIDMQKS